MLFFSKNTRNDLLKYGDRYMTSRIIVENHLAGCFEYLMCQQMTPMAALFLADYKSLFTNNQNIQ